MCLDSPFSLREIKQNQLQISAQKSWGTWQLFLIRSRWSFKHTSIFYALKITWNGKRNDAVLPLKKKGAMTVLLVSYRRGPMSRVSEKAKPLSLIKKKSDGEFCSKRCLQDLYCLIIQMQIQGCIIWRLAQSTCSLYRNASCLQRAEQTCCTAALHRHICIFLSQLALPKPRRSSRTDS